MMVSVYCFFIQLTILPSSVCRFFLATSQDSVGERSSQYAAEASCRLRFGPHTEWLGQVSKLDVKL